jgi:hypothetical protein
MLLLSSCKCAASPAGEVLQPPRISASSLNSQRIAARTPVVQHSEPCQGRLLHDMCACPAVSQRILPGPEAAARMAAEASGKQRKEADAHVVKATGDALHLLGWLRMALPLLSGGHSCSVVCRHLPSGQLPYVVETARRLA